MSPILYSIAIDDVTSQVQVPAQYNLYADNLMILLQNSDINTEEEILIKSINQLQL